MRSWVLFLGLVLQISPCFAADADSLLTAVLPDTFPCTQPMYIYGERFEAPHDLSWEDHVLFCHGVQIVPPLEPPRPALSEWDTAVFALFVSADSAWRATGHPRTSPEGMAASREALERSPLVTQATLANSTTIKVLFTNGRVTYVGGEKMFESSGMGPRSPVSPYQEAASEYEHLRREWAQNRLIFYGAGYLTSLTSNRAPAALQQITQAIGGATNPPGPLQTDVLKEVVSKAAQKRTDGGR